MGGGVGRLALTQVFEHQYAHDASGVERGEQEELSPRPIGTHTTEQRAMVGEGNLALALGLMHYPHDCKRGLQQWGRAVSPSPWPHRCPYNLILEQKELDSEGVGSWP